MTFKSASYAALALLLSCGRSHKRMPQYYDFGHAYSLRIAAVTVQSRKGNVELIKVTPRVDVHGEHFESKSLNGYGNSPGASLWLELTNKTNQPVRVLWPDVRYFDEKGEAHEVYWRRRSLPLDPKKIDASTPTVLNPNETLRPTIQPTYKTYDVQYNTEESGEFSEPLVPTKLEGMSEQQMKAYVDDLAKRQVPVKLVLPIEIEGKRYDYTFTFVLKPRWADLPKQ